MKVKEWQILEPCRRTEKVVIYEGQGNTNSNWSVRIGFQGIKRTLEKLEISGLIKSIQTTELLRSARILVIYQRDQRV